MDNWCKKEAARIVEVKKPNDSDTEMSPPMAQEQNKRQWGRFKAESSEAKPRVLKDNKGNRSECEKHEKMAARRLLESSSPTRSPTGCERSNAL